MLSAIFLPGISLSSLFLQHSPLPYIFGSLNTDEVYISEFGEILLYMIAGILFVVFSFFISRLLRPNRPNPQKLAPYESGEEAVGSAWTQFNVRFYIIALIFILFEAEIIFLFPWSTVFADKALNKETRGMWGWFALWEAIIFILIIALGLVYAWVHGHLDWIKPNPEVTSHHSPIPRTLYDAINSKFAKKPTSSK
ncbi:MAG TPA: NADH-quinone oxidoreductase subunit A [Chryseosolibacter sp.]|nr:NADH-quinone oxidoreductase subunit A [Chryseosolibacter sp.]